MIRLDKILVDLSLAPTRTKSQEIIKNGHCYVNDKLVNKCNTLVDINDKITIKNNDVLKYVSRGGLKLEHALREFNYSVKNKKMMDIGSSTGGFSDCALQNGVASIIAIDVGTNVMDSSLRLNPKIDLHENTNIKYLDDAYYNNIDFITVDVSFISLKKIIDIVSSKNITVDMLVLIKPQFECGSEIAKKYKGIILNKDIHINILNDMVNYLHDKNFYIKGLTYSPIKGGDGNIEYIAYITNKDQEEIKIDVNNLVTIAFNK